jgi:hypothetical protein
MGMFLEECDKHWVAGRSVIPVRAGGKKASLPGWQRHCHEFPSEEEQAAIKAHAKDKGETNIGLCLGKASGMIGLDKDNRPHDPMELEMIDAVVDLLPESPILKHGNPDRRGTSFYKDNGEAYMRFTYPGRVERTGEKGPLIELLAGAGKQTVIPPSIHAETGKPYYYERGSLEQVHVDELPSLPPDFRAKVQAAIDRVYQEYRAFFDHQDANPSQGGGRHDKLLSQFRAAREKKKPLNIIADELWEFDQKHHTPPYLSDTKKYPEFRGKTARQNASRLVERFEGWLLSKTPPDETDKSPHPPPKVTTFHALTPLPPRVIAPPLRPELLPEVLRQWVFDCAERIGCAPDFPAMAALTAAASLVGIGYRMLPKQLDTSWVVVVNLWGLLVGLPSSKKTPGMRAGLGPFKRIEDRIKANYKRDLARAQPELKRYKAAQKKLERSIADFDLDRANEIIPAQNSEYERLTEAIRQATPINEKLSTNDVTIEKLILEMVDSPNGIMIVRDELNGLFSSFTQKGHEQDRSFYLTAFEGDQDWDGGRITRGDFNPAIVKAAIIGGFSRI